MFTSGQTKRLRALHGGPNRLSGAMEIAEVTQAQVAVATGFTQGYVSDVARGRHATITLDNARRFAEFFGCSIDDLFPPKAQVA